MWKYSLSNTVFSAVFSLENLAVNSILPGKSIPTPNKKFLFLLEKIPKSVFLII